MARRKLTNKMRKRLAAINREANDQFLRKLAISILDEMERPLRLEVIKGLYKRKKKKKGKES